MYINRTRNQRNNIKQGKRNTNRKENEIGSGTVYVVGETELFGRVNRCIRYLEEKKYLIFKGCQAIVN